MTPLWGRALAARLRADRDIDPTVAEAMIAVRRHRFVRWRSRLHAYEDYSLPTGDGTSISQPSYIAKVLTHARVQPGDRVLEIGTGSGWTAAILARLAREVVTVERVPALAESARRRLADLANVRALEGDGVRVADGAFDAIVVMAGAPTIPPAYRALLRDGGRLVIPVGQRTATSISCRVVRVTRRGDDFVEEDLMPGDWNTLVGADGFADR